jgi:hypothetical protein
MISFASFPARWDNRMSWVPMVLKTKTCACLIIQPTNPSLALVQGASLIQVLFGMRLMTVSRQGNPSPKSLLECVTGSLLGLGDGAHFPLSRLKRDGGDEPYQPFLRITALLRNTFGLSTGVKPALRALLTVCSNATFETWNGGSTTRTCPAGLSIDSMSLKSLSWFGTSWTM